MLSRDYWVVKYRVDGKKHLQHICANYKQYTIEKIKKIFNELKNSEEIWLCPDCRVFRTPRTELPSGSEEDEENEDEELNMSDKE
jgi:hypothetical protein